MSSTASHRLVILTQSEINDLYNLPQFDDNDRRHYFEMGDAELQSTRLRRPSAGIFLALELGYFKAKKQFFSFEVADVLADLNYLVKRYFFSLEVAKLRLPSKPTRQVIRQSILSWTSYFDCDANAKLELMQKMQRTAAFSTQPLFILREALQHLANKRCVAPRYTTLQDLVGRAVASEGVRLTKLLVSHASASVMLHLDQLLEGDEAAMSISAVKREPKNFSWTELKSEVERRKVFEPLHEFAGSFLKLAGLSYESGKYFASLVKFYTLYKLQRMDKDMVRLYLLCFALHRLRQINDNLIEAFVYMVGQFEKQAKLAANEARQKTFDGASTNLQAAGEVLSLFIDESISSESPFSDVQQRAFEILDPQTFKDVSNYLRNIAFDQVAHEWTYLSSVSLTIKRNLRQLFNELDFSGRVAQAPLAAAIAVFQETFKKDLSLQAIDVARFPATLIPKNHKRNLYREVASPSGKASKILDVDRYEFMVYRLLRDALESGDMFVNHSNEFRRFEDDLISDARWEAKEAVLAEIAQPIIQTPIEQTLASFRGILKARFDEVNQRISEGVNQHIKVTGQGGKKRWNLIYPTTNGMDAPT